MPSGAEAFHRQGLSIAAIAGYVNPVAAIRHVGAPTSTACRRSCVLPGIWGRPGGDGIGTLHPDDDWAPHSPERHGGGA
jgi:hypothetical protein